MFIRLAQSQIEEYIVKDNFKGTDEYFIKFEEFVQRLQIPADNVSITLFKLFVQENEVARDVIDFKDYLLHALFLIKLSEPKIELIRVMFLVRKFQHSSPEICFNKHLYISLYIAIW